MFDSPLPLQDYCLGFIRDSVSEPPKDPGYDASDSDYHHHHHHNNVANINHPHHPHQNPNGSPASSHSVCPLMSGTSCSLSCNLSEKLMTDLSNQGRLVDQVMIDVFQPHICRLEHVRITDAQHLTKKGLRVLRGHRIQTLEVNGLTKATINELIGCLGDFSLNNITSLSVSRSYFTSSSRFCVVVGLAKLRNLRHLDVGHTDINHHGLEIIVEDLPLLQSLNISNTRVKDLNPLRKCRTRLRSLSMYNLKSNTGTGEEFFPILMELNQLHKLDISDDRESPVDVLTRNQNSLSNLLKRPDLFPYLQYLDISGRDGIDLDDLKKFICFKHRLGPQNRIQFLGLMQTDLCANDAFSGSEDPEYRDIQVTGSATEDQILKSLQVYVNRPTYIQKSLCYLYNYTINDVTEPRVDVVDIILPSMKNHLQVLGIQMAGTACLYNLTKGKVGDKIHPKWLAKVVNATLDAMENFPTHQQLQKNTLLTLCSDRILQEVTFNRYKCTRLVMDSLVNFKDASMNRMAVAVCSILAAKISTYETSSLGAKPIYMETMLGVVRSRVQSFLHSEQTPPDPEPDIMLKFTLSALWNLTDESPTTCEMFLEKGGISLYLDVLRTYRGFATVETKVLGLLNNIAEVPRLRGGLKCADFIMSLRSLLKSKHIDVSYFSAGIFAHLLSDGCIDWDFPQTPKDQVIFELVEAVLTWKAPEVEMVAYRSFNPFLSLLGCDIAQVQLWAVWAIHHVCSKNPGRYCDMLLEGETWVLFKKVIMSANMMGDESLQYYCKMTIEVLKKEYPHLTVEFP